jgi:hypothetical protein
MSSTQDPSHVLLTYAHPPTSTLQDRIHKTHTSTPKPGPHTTPSSSTDAILPRLHPRLLLTSTHKLAFIDDAGWYCQPLADPSNSEEIMDATEENIAVINRFLEGTGWDSKEEGAKVHPRIWIDADGKIGFFARNGVFFQPAGVEGEEVVGTKGEGEEEEVEFMEATEENLEMIGRFLRGVTWEDERRKAREGKD